MLTQIIVVSFLFILLISIVSIVLMLFIKFRSDRLFRSITNFESYAAVLEYYMNKAYDMIYKDKLMIYSLEATRVNDVQFNSIAKEFAKLVLKLIGKTLKDEFIFVYGSEDTLYFNITEYFHTRYENDEIHKTSTEELMKDDSDTLFGEPKT
jgi:hypothetical protein